MVTTNNFLSLEPSREISKALSRLAFSFISCRKGGFNIYGVAQNNIEIFRQNINIKD